MTARRETSAVFSHRDQCSNVKLSDAKLLLFAHGSHGLGLSQTGSDQEESDDARGTNTNIQTVAARKHNASQQLHNITKLRLQR